MDFDDDFYDVGRMSELFQQALHRVQHDASKPIQHLMPHYTDTYFKEARTVYLAEGYKVKRGDYGETVKGAEYNYSDRIQQWHTSEQYDAAWDAAKTSGHKLRSAAFLEVYLRTIFEKPNLKLVHILAGFNWSNGYPYQVYGYIADPQAPDAGER